MKQDAKKFVPKLDFLTTPGYLTGPGAREAAGLPAGSGPYRVITDLAVMDYHPETKRMRVIALHPGVNLDRVKAATGFELHVAETLARSPEPSDRELELLRTQVDPRRFLLGKAD
jgi:glutaconate CoA-transferase subunit B